MCASLLQGLTCLSTGQKSYIRSAAERYQPSLPPPQTHAPLAALPAAPPPLLAPAPRALLPPQQPHPPLSLARLRRCYQRLQHPTVPRVPAVWQARQPCIKELQETMLLQSSHLSVTLGNDHQRNIHNDGTPFSSDAVTASRANKPVYRACMSSW
eukprot:scaffold10159_cov22-Tisochrysis_lutea.AAC.1